MLNNDVLRSLRYTLKVSDAQMAEIAALGGCTVAEAEVRAWLSREDEDGYWFIVDRVKELIKYKGYQVAPAELEALLLTHPDIVDSGVVGVVRDGLEIPRAFVVREEGSTLAAEELMEWVAERVTPYEKVRAVEFVDEIPKNPTGKIERKKLRAVPFEA